MAELRTLLTDAGYKEVRTLGQSGNVVLSHEGDPGGLARALSREISQGTDMRVDVVVRTRDELAEVIARDPFGSLISDPKRYVVSFLAQPLAPERARELGSLDLAPERVSVGEREIYAWHPGGSARSQLAQLLTDRRLGVSVTARNWSTVRRLLALADGAS